MLGGRSAGAYNGAARESVAGHIAFPRAIRNPGFCGGPRLAGAMSMPSSSSATNRNPFPRNLCLGVILRGENDPCLRNIGERGFADPHANPIALRMACASTSVASWENGSEARQRCFGKTIRGTEAAPNCVAMAKVMTGLHD